LRKMQTPYKLFEGEPEDSSPSRAEVPVSEQDSDSEKSGAASEKPLQKYAPIDVDIYGAAVSSLICDTNALALGRHCETNSIRAFRVIISFTGCWLHMGLQTYLLYMTSSVISTSVITKFRKTYSIYELHMYGDNMNATYMTRPNYHRGHPEHFDPTRFATLDDVIQHTICQMPMANDVFFLAIIFAWTLSCIVDVRKSSQMFHAFIVRMPCVPTVSQSVKHFVRDHDEPEVAIVGIPLHFKAILFFLILLPRLIVDAMTIWLGCTWLAATSQMGDLLLNAVALEFVVLLNELIVRALVPKHGLDGLERTKTIVASSRMESAEVPCVRLRLAECVAGLQLGRQRRL